MKRNLWLVGSLAAAILLVASGFSVRGFAGSAPAAKHFAPGRLQVYVLDVGRGESVLVVSPVGKAALIDAGSAEAGARVVSQLRRKGVQNLEVVVATQAGADYIGGLRRVAGSSDIVIKNFIDSAQPWKTDVHQQVLAAVQSAGAPVTPARRGQVFDLGGGARLDILNPAGDGQWAEATEGAGRENANAVVVRLLYREFAMLIMSGAGSQTAERLIEARQNLWAPFLVVGGARGAVSEKMLSIVQPRFAIISTGAGAGLAPAPETIERLKGAGAEIYRTDLQGEISLSSDGRKHEIAGERKSAP
jgi:competence protein ComEC